MDYFTPNQALAARKNKRECHSGKLSLNLIKIDNLVKCNFTSPSALAPNGIRVSAKVIGKL